MENHNYTDLIASTDAAYSRLFIEHATKRDEKRRWRYDQRTSDDWSCNFFL